MNEGADPVPEEVNQERLARLMKRQAEQHPAADSQSGQDDDHPGG